jgi:hypothetical protein
MVELIGADSVIAWINQSHKPCIKIWRVSDGGNSPPVFSFKGQDETKAAEAFAEWAKIMASNPNNSTAYRLYVSDDLIVDEDNLQGKGGITSETGKKLNRMRGGAMATTFALNSQVLNGEVRRDPSGNITYIQPAPIGQPANPVPSVDLTKYVAKEEMNAAVAHAILNAQMQQRLNELEAENIELHRTIRELEDMLDEEEEAIGEEKSIMEIWTPEAVQNLIGTAKETFLDIKGSRSNSVHQPLNAVAGQPEVEAQPKVVTIPAGAEPGTYPPYVTPTVENAALMQADQQKKLQDAIARLYAKDVHIGDDLQIIAGIAENKPNRFRGLLESLREE